MLHGPPGRTVGVRLREARERRGVSLQQIAAKTRISLMSLEALERSDLARLPGGIFTRAFIRAYAHEVGLDPERMIEEFVAELPPESPAVRAHTAALEDGEKLESDRRAAATALRLGLVSLPIVVLVIYYGTARRGPDDLAPPPVRPAASAGTVASPGVAEVPPPSVPEEAVVLTAGASGSAESKGAEDSGSTAAAAGLTLEIIARAACRVSLAADGEQGVSEMLEAGDTRRVTARREISITVSDATAVEYTLNGRAGRPLGAPGEVASRTITSSDLQEHLGH